MKDRTLFILIGVVAVLAVSLFQRKKYQLGFIKTIISMVLIAIVGVLGTLLMYFIENGEWGGISFYGSVFIIPMFLYSYSKIIKEPYTKMSDFYVPQVCAMSAVMKILCLKSGCCGGIELFEKADGTIVKFPSQIVEMISVILIMLLFLYFEHKGLFKGRFYPLFFIIYGSVRFALNFLRADLNAFVWFIPSGHFWSIVAIVIGATWLLLAKSNNESKKITN